MKKMQRLEEIQKKLSFVFGKKPIVYLVTEDIDFIDELFIYDGEFKPVDNIKGEPIPVNKAEYVKKHYNSSQSKAWKSLVDDDGDLVRDEFTSGDYCYIKNFNYLYCMNEKRSEKNFYTALMKYVVFYNKLEEREKEKNVLILSGNSYSVPDAVSPFVEVIEVPYPYTSDIFDMFYDYNIVSDASSDYQVEFWNNTAKKMKGFTSIQISDIIKTLLMYFPRVAMFNKTRLESEVSPFLSKHITDQKEQIVKKDGILKYIDVPDEKDVQVAGCGNVEQFVYAGKDIFLDPTAFKGATPMKGVIFAGVPGSGKSLMAKKIAAILDKPLLQLDMGSLMNKYVGESEERLRRALKMVESVAPCVLFIDELEKAFAGGGGNDEGGHESSKRMFGYMLGWMQECKKPVFIYATANHINKLDSAFLRSGRFDNKYMALMPNREQCVDIFIGCLKKRAKNMPVFRNTESKMFEKNLSYQIGEAFDCASNDGQFMTGADIECWVNKTFSSMYTSGRRIPFDENAFFEELNNSLHDISAYGKTNMNDVVNYWLLNYFNSFSMCDTPLFAFSDFDLERKNVTNENDGTSEQTSYFIKRERRDFQSNYDYNLYTAITKAIDKKSKSEIKSKFIKF